MEQVIFRKAMSSDVSALFNFIMQLAKHHDQSEYVTTDEYELLNSGFGKDPKFEVLLAEYKHEMIGYVSYTRNYSIWSGKAFLNLDDLYIRKQYRGFKIGQGLMQLVKSICENEGIRLIRWEVETDNQGAIEFYKRLGAKMTLKGVFRWDLDT